MGAITRATLLILAGILVSAPARTEIVKYRTADGGIGFAERRDVPAGAEIVSSGTRGTVSRAAAAPEREAQGAEPPSEPEAAPANVEADIEALWKEKRREALDRLRELRTDHASVLSAMREMRCRRGDFAQYPGVTDRESLTYGQAMGGVRIEDAACDDLRESLALVEAEREKLEEYLAEGLEEECRRDPDCLPGYLRD